MRKSQSRLGEQTMLLDDFLSGERNDDYDVIAIFFRGNGYSPDDAISEHDFRELRNQFKEINGF